MKGRRIASAEERSVVEATIALVYHYDKSTPEGRKAITTVYGDLFDVVLQLIIDPKVFGRIDTMARRLLKGGSLTQKDIQSIISDAHPALPDKKVVYDW